MGAEISLKLPLDNSQRLDEILFGEGGGRILVSIAPEQQEIWESYLQENLGQNWQKLGKVGNSEIGLRVLSSDGQTLINARIEEMGDRYSKAIKRRLAVYTNTQER